MLFVSEKFSNFVMLFLGIADISKVFFAVLNRKSDSFHKAKGLTNSTHFLYSYVAMHFLCIYSILSKCGALYRLFLLGFCQSLRLNKRKINSTLSFLYKPAAPELLRQNKLFMKKILMCVAMVAMLAACSKGEGEDGFIMSPMSDPDDVFSAMDDAYFVQYCYANFDINGDAKVSKAEAAAVTSINFRYGNYSINK